MTRDTLRIAMVSEHASPLATLPDGPLGAETAGGQNVHVAALGRALAARGHHVTVYTRRDGERLPDRVRMAPGLVVEHVPAGPAEPVPRDELLPYMDGFGDYLADRWADDLPSVVHAHFWMSGLAALRGAAPHQVPVVQTFHALGSVKRRYQGDADTSPPDRIRLEGELGRAVDRIVATCRDEVRELGRLDVPTGKVTVAPCGVDSGLFTPDGPTARRAGRRRLLSVSRLVERKGIADVVRALPRIPDAELVVAGGADRAGTPRFEADPVVAELRAVAERHGVADRVRLLGQVAQPDLPPLYRSADLVVCTPWYEPFGIVPLEAMACGVPVVAGAVGGLLDTVLDGVTGRHVPPRDPDALAGAVGELLADPVRRRAMSEAGVRRARERYSWRQVAITTEVAYGQVVPDRRSAAGMTRGAAR